MSCCGGTTNTDDIRDKVKEHYAEIASQTTSGGCCTAETNASMLSQSVGYSGDQLNAIPADANLGLGCGNPTAIAGIRTGETVVDLGSGGGIDCFLAAKAVGLEGRVIGVDMTDEMLDRARRNAAKGGYANVEFRKGLIEELPIEDATADLVISNCVINLSPDKPRVFREVNRVLKSGGRMVVSDLVVTEDLPAAVRGSVEAYCGCVAGAMQVDEYLGAIRDAGFEDVEELSRSSYGELLSGDPEFVARLAEEYGADAASVARWASAVLSIKLRAVKRG